MSTSSRPYRVVLPPLRFLANLLRGFLDPHESGIWARGSLLMNMFNPSRRVSLKVSFVRYLLPSEAPNVIKIGNDTVNVWDIYAVTHYLFFLQG